MTTSFSLIRSLFIANPMIRATKALPNQEICLFRRHNHSTLFPCIECFAAKYKNEQKGSPGFWCLNWTHLHNEQNSVYTDDCNGSVIFLIRFLCIPAGPSLLFSSEVLDEEGKGSSCPPLHRMHHSDQALGWFALRFGEPSLISDRDKQIAMNRFT